MVHQWQQYQFDLCGDWMMRLNVDFTSGDGATFSNWIGSETLNTIRDDK